MPSFTDVATKIEGSSFEELQAQLPESAQLHAVFVTSSLGNSRVATATKTQFRVISQVPTASQYEDVMQRSGNNCDWYILTTEARERLIAAEISGAADYRRRHPGVPLVLIVRRITPGESWWQRLLKGFSRH
jgi:chlorite dismutase